MSGALVAQAINESIGTAGFQGLDAILKEYLGLIAEQAGTARVPISRTINGHSLERDVDLTNNDVAAAPAGYGLGTFANEVDSIDDLRLTGFYKFYNAGIPLISGTTDTYYCNVEVICSGEGVLQRITTAYSGLQAIRRRTGGVWSEWEWVNPPMQVGVEYRTTERYKSKPVYTKLHYFGEATNDKVIQYTDESVTPIRNSGVIGSYNTPYLFDATFGSSYMCYFVVVGNSARMYCGDSITGQTAYLQIWYVKN